MVLNRILNHKSGVEILLFFLTLVKIIVVYFLFQNIIIFENGVPQIAPGYAWSELISNMHNGEYYNTSQYSLAELYNLKFHALRPPVYSAFLYSMTFMGSYAGLMAVLLQSIATSLIAFMGYKIIKMNSASKIIPFVIMLILFILPFNFLKSGSLDDAVFMMLFLLCGIFFLIKGIDLSRFNSKFIIAGLFFGLAILTRPAALFPLVGISLFIIIKYWRSYQGILIFFLVIAFVLSPWIIRNHNVIGKPVYTNGGGRVLLLMQSNEFIDNFPDKSIDIIDRDYFTSNHSKYSYINQLPEKDIDTEFVNLAIDEAIHNPAKLIKSYLVKLKSFVPFDYYPVRGNFMKSIVFLFSYWSAIFLFAFALIFQRKRRVKTLSSSLILVSIISYSLIGLLMFMLSRHFYPLIVFLFISSGIALANSNLKFLKDD